MSAIVQIDKAGRIVVPKKLRDALHLIPGTRLRIDLSGGVLRMEQDLPEPTLEMRDGLLVINGPKLATNEDFVKLVDEQRDRRMSYVSGLSDEP